MSYLPPPLSERPRSSPPSVFISATYRTNPNPPEHSKWNQRRLTLVMLSILRVPLMVRAGFIIFLLFSLFSASALGARINAVQLSERHSIKNGSVHRTHRPVHVKQKSAHPKSRTTHAVASRHSSLGTAHLSAHHAVAARRHTYKAGARHARYAVHSTGHFVPIATVPIERHKAIESDSASPVTTTSAPVNELSALRVSDSRQARVSSAQVSTPAETDQAPVPGPEPSAVAGARNLLSAPPVVSHPIEPGDDQFAELRAPQIFSPRVNSYTLRGTHDSLVRQNQRAQLDDLERIEDDVDLQDRIAHGMLVRVPESAALTVNPALPDDRRYCRPWTADFLADLSRAHQAQFRKPLVVSSAVRTVEYQKHLMRTNHNAADAEGDIVSPHLTGATVDIAKSGLSRKEMLWMRNQLLAYQNAGVIDVEEEFHQRCFHITVYKNYVASSASSHSQRKTSVMPAQSAADAPASAGLSHE